MNRNALKQHVLLLEVYGVRKGLIVIGILLILIHTGANGALRDTAIVSHVAVYYSVACLLIICVYTGPWLPAAPICEYFFSLPLARTRLLQFHMVKSLAILAIPFLLALRVSCSPLIDLCLALFCWASLWLLLILSERFLFILGHFAFVAMLLVAGAFAAGFAGVPVHSVDYRLGVSIPVGVATALLSIFALLFVVLAIRVASSLSLTLDFHSVLETWMPRNRFLKSTDWSLFVTVRDSDRRAWLITKLLPFPLKPPYGPSILVAAILFEYFYAPSENLWTIVVLPGFSLSIMWLIPFFDVVKANHDEYICSLPVSRIKALATFVLPRTIMCVGYTLLLATLALRYEGNAFQLRDCQRTCLYLWTVGMCPSILDYVGSILSDSKYAWEPVLVTLLLSILTIVAVIAYGWAGVFTVMFSLILLDVLALREGLRSGLDASSRSLRLYWQWGPFPSNKR
ncbi:hypothetical protein ACFL1X_13100 [Candidatus Hydrogenedentota bacterium]